MKTLTDDEAERVLREKFGIHRPKSLMTEEQLRKRERELALEQRRDRLFSSPIRESLGVDDQGVTDETRILRDRLAPTLPLRAVQKWVNGWSNPHTQSVTKPWLIMAGGTGTGKTVAAGWAIAEVGARYVRFPEAIQDFRALTRKSSLTELDAMRLELRRKYGVAGFLVLDEIGIEETKDADDARIALGEIAELRQRWHQRTLGLTNKSAAEIRERFRTGVYDQRTLSRIQRLLVSGDVVDLAGRDLRVPSSKRGGDR